MVITSLPHRDVLFTYSQFLPASLLINVLTEVRVAGGRLRAALYSGKYTMMWTSWCRLGKVGHLGVVDWVLMLGFPASLPQRVWV